MSARALLLGLAKRVPAFFGITLLTFAVARLAPGDPFGSEEWVAAPQASPGSLPAEYLLWLGRVLTLDFGRSLEDARPVIEKLGEALPRTLLLASLALLLALALGIPLGVFAALRERHWFARALSHGLLALYSVPTFWVALLLLFAFASTHGVDWLPFQGLHSDGVEGVGDLLAHLVLPVTCLALPLLAMVSRQLRATLRLTLETDFIRAARARGVPATRVLFHHGLRNGLLPLITLVSVWLPQLFGGSVVVERTFGIWGMGNVALEAVLHRDYPVVMGVCTVMALVTLAAIWLAELLYGWADPRVRR